MNVCKPLTTVLLFFCITQAMGQLRLPSVLSSGMVLQQNDSVTIWGWSQPAEKIFVTPTWDHQTDSTLADNGANWRIRIKTPAAGGPFKITIRGNTSIELSDILVGEVWVCSGQSNMEMNEQWGKLPDIKAERAGKLNNQIRFFQIPKTTSAYPQDDCFASWVPCDSNSIQTFSAVAYFFGKKLNKELNVPIGLINASWGGTPAEVWTPAAMVNENAELKAASDKQSVVNWWPNNAGMTFNGMIAPITNYSVAGAIWYQGEGNTVAPLTYGKLLTTLIDGWRKAWGRNLPFYYVQIAPFKYESSNVGNLIREQQAAVLKHPNVGMVVASDLVDDTTDIHPKNKHDVGSRLANWALAETYHKTGIAYKNPSYKSMEIKKELIMIMISDAPEGLMIRNKSATEMFVAAADKIFYPATVKIEGSKLIVSSKLVKQPVAVRYSFSNSGIGNIFGKNGLPLAPFRSDDWTVEQDAEK